MNIFIRQSWINVFPEQNIICEFSFIILKILLDLLYMSFADNFFAFFNGMVAGIFSPISGWSQVFVMQPFEIIKVRLQTQSAANKMYNGIADCLMKIIKNEGFFALYKGIPYLDFRKCHSFNRSWYPWIDEIRPLWELQENNGQIKWFKLRIINNCTQITLRIFCRLH